MVEKHWREIKEVTGNGAVGTISFRLPIDQRAHAVRFLVNKGSTDTLAATLAAITGIRAKVGTDVKINFENTTGSTGAQKLHDYLLLNGTGYAFTGTPTASGANNGVKMYLPFAEPWFLASVADSLAWNPQRLGGEITIELDVNVACTVTPSVQVSNDIKAPSSGFISIETISPIAAGTKYVFSKELEARGRLLQMSIYPDGGGSNAANKVTVFRGSTNIPLHEGVFADSNQQELLSNGMSSTASGRSTTSPAIYDVVSVKGDALSHSWDMSPGLKVQVEALSAMSGVQPIVVARIERNKKGDL